ncbi:MAG: Fic family protein [Fimbriimonadales bacterium]
MASLHYLTVQDIVWINLQITKKVQHFKYARLEEAVFYQYAYGESNSLFPQAARFVAGFPKMHPFDAGNEATAMVACLAFLQINGHSAKDASDIGKWFRRVTSKEIEGAAAIEEIAVPNPEAHHGPADVRGAVIAILGKHAPSIVSLLESAAA